MLTVASIAAGILGYRIHSAVNAQRLGVAIAWRLIPRSIRDDETSGDDARTVQRDWG